MKEMIQLTSNNSYKIIISKLTLGNINRTNNKPSANNNILAKK